MTDSIQAIVADKDDRGAVSAELKTISMDDLPDEDVLVDVAYSTVNYKDGLAVTGTMPICREFPMVCGIDLAGTVVESSNARWQPGDRVLANGFGLSEVHWGGYAQKQRINGEFLIRVPDAYELKDTMAIGTAGYTAMLCVNAIRDHGTQPSDGPILVTGAGGGVGSIAVMTLAKLGFEVAASTGRPEIAEYLKGIGASTIVPRGDLARESKPLEKETWAGVVDAVGDTTLATAIAQIKHEGIVAACGIAGGFALPSTVMPFILRGVTLRGVESIMTSRERRERAWTDLARLVSSAELEGISQTEPLSRVLELGQQILKGQIRGRIVIDVNA